MRKKYRITVRKLREGDSEKWSDEYIADVDDVIDKDSQLEKRICTVYKSGSEDAVFTVFELSIGGDEVSLLEDKALELRDFYDRDAPEIIVEEIDILDGDD